MGVDYSTVSQGRKRLRETLKRETWQDSEVYKFKFHQQYLLAPEIQGNDIVIYMIGLTMEIFQKQENMR